MASVTATQSPSPVITLEATAPAIPSPMATQEDEELPVEIAFSASGGAFVYQMGVAAYLQEHFDLSQCHISGCSGGSWAATLLASDTNVFHAWAIMQQTQARVIPGPASWYTGYGRYARVIAETVMELWKNDPNVHERVASKNLSIAVTRFPSMAAETHSSWENLEDLQKSILASAMIPFALSGKPCITHRGNWYVDGCITNFKGVNCESYSTWSDLYYHGLQMAVDTVRATTNAVTDFLAPSMAKPVAKLVDGLLPQFESPHDAIAPRLSNGVDSGASIASRTRLIIKPWTWRSHSVTAFHLSLNVDSHQQRFDDGYEDARLHHDELLAVLPLRSPMSDGV